MSIANYFRTSLDAELRSHGQTLWFVASALKHLTPSSELTIKSECSYCYRHTLSGSTCSLHKPNGEYRTTPQQKTNYRIALQDEIKNFNLQLKKNPEVATSIEHLTPDSKNVLPELKMIIDKLFSKETSEIFNSIINAKGGDKNFATIVSQWYKHPQVTDTSGWENIKKSNTPVILQFISDIAKYNAFQVIGGDIDNKKRPIVKVNPDEIEFIIAGKKEGKSVRELADLSDISPSQVRQVLRDHNLLPTTKKTKSEQPLGTNDSGELIKTQEKRGRGRPSKK